MTGLLEASETLSEISFLGSSTCDESDIAFIENRSTRKPWQNELMEKFFDDGNNQFLKANDRTVVWIFDQEGAVGKSKFVKWFCKLYESKVCKLPFGSLSQLRSAVISAGPRLVYFIDIPKTRPTDDSLESLISVCEDIKNRHIVSVMYDKYRNMMMADRWDEYNISKKLGIFEK